MNSLALIVSKTIPRERHCTICSEISASLPLICDVISSLDRASKLPAATPPLPSPDLPSMDSPFPSIYPSHALSPQGPPSLYLPPPPLSYQLPPPRQLPTQNSLSSACREPTVSPPTYHLLLSLTISAALVAQRRFAVPAPREVKGGCSGAIGAIALLRVSRDWGNGKWTKDMEGVRGILMSE